MMFTVCVDGSVQHPSEIRDFIARMLREECPNATIEVHHDDSNFDENGEPVNGTPVESVAAPGEEEDVLPMFDPATMAPVKVTTENWDDVSDAVFEAAGTLLAPKLPTDIGPNDCDEHNGLVVVRDYVGDREPWVYVAILKAQDQGPTYENISFARLEPLHAFRSKGGV